MRLLLRFAAASVLLMPVAVPVGAENSSWDQLPIARAREIADYYSRCVVTRLPNLAQDYITSFAEIPTLAPKYRWLLDPACMPLNVERLKMPGDMLSYSIADALVRKRRLTPPEGGFAARAPLVHPEIATAARVDHLALDERDPAKKARLVAIVARLRQEDFASRFGECVSRADPARSYALLTTPVGDDEETSALQNLQPVMAACISKDHTTRFNRVMLRGGIALSYARLSLPNTSTAGH